MGLFFDEAEEEDILADVAAAAVEVFFEVEIVFVGILGQELAGIFHSYYEIAGGGISCFDGLYAVIGIEVDGEEFEHVGRHMGVYVAFGLQPVKQLRHFPVAFGVEHRRLVNSGESPVEGYGQRESSKHVPYRRQPFAEEEESHGADYRNLYEDPFYER